MRKTALFLLLVMIGCSSSSSDSGNGGTTDDGGGGSDAGGSHDAGATGDAGGGSDSGGGSDATAGGDGASGDDASSGMLTLTINNYLQWCSVTVDGGTASTADPIPVQVAPNTVVHLHGDTRSSADFVWGYWLGVDADAGAHDTNMDVAVTVTKNMTIQACCPTTGAPTTPCPPP